MAQGLPVLVVEDDPNLREAVCDTLELAGQAVVSATDRTLSYDLLRDFEFIASDARRGMRSTHQATGAAQ